MFNFTSKGISLEKKYLILKKDNISSKKFVSSSSVKVFLKESEQLFSFDGVAFDIWNLLEKKILFEDLIRKLKNEYKVSEKKLKKDVIRFIKELEKYQMVKILEK